MKNSESPISKKLLCISIGINIILVIILIVISHNYSKVESRLEAARITKEYYEKIFIQAEQAFNRCDYAAASYLSMDNKTDPVADNKTDPPPGT